MKIWLLSSTLFLCCHVFGQTGVVVLTEEFTLSAPFTAKIHVTMPNGTSSTTNITHEFTNVAQHDINLNNIINSIVNQGYKIIPAPEGWGMFGAPNSGGLRRIFFGVPWTTVVDELISTTDSTTNMSVFPNPANNELKISLIMTDDDYVFYVVDLNGLIIIKDTKTQIDISSLSDGHYILYAVRKNKHYLSEKFIKN